MTNTYLKLGTTYRVFDDSVEAFDELPVGSYTVEFDPNSGFSLRATSDLSTSGRVYGNHAARVDRIMNTYARTDRSLGVLLTGDKGMGKSLLIRMLAERAIDAGIPVVRVTRRAPGIADFLDTLDEAMIVFDEFEKVFPLDDEDCMSQQDQFLPLFDGISNTKRIYAVSANATGGLSNFLLNRPGRFHYHLRVSYPTPEEARQYLVDQAPNADPSDVDKAVGLTHRLPLNYDHLRAIAFELESGAAFAEFINDLNIKRDAQTLWNLTVHLKSGATLTESAWFDAAGDHTTLRVTVSDTQGANVRLDMTQAVSADDGGLWFSAEDLRWSEPDKSTEAVVGISAQLAAHRELIL